MSIKLKPIDRSNYQECIDLTVSENQKRFVASNAFSLVQAAYEPEMYPLGIYHEDKMVGFILYDFDDEINGWSMSRFMIDSKFQKRGYGEEALASFLDFFSKKHKEELLYTSAEVDNNVAIKVYEKYGFEKKNTFEYTHNGVTYHEVRMVRHML